MLIKRFTETAVLPRRATEGSAGYDLSADLSQPEVIQPGESKLLPTAPQTIVGSVISSLKSTVPKPSLVVVPSAVHCTLKS